MRVKSPTPTLPIDGYGTVPSGRPYIYWEPLGSLIDNFGQRLVRKTALQNAHTQ